MSEREELKKIVQRAFTDLLAGEYNPAMQSFEYRKANREKALECAVASLEALSRPNLNDGASGAESEATRDHSLAASPSSGWRPITPGIGTFPILVGRERDRYLWGPYAAFRDIGGTWRIHGGDGCEPLHFEPTLYQPLPPSPGSARDMGSRVAAQVDQQLREQPSLDTQNEGEG